MRVWIYLGGWIHLVHGMAHAPAAGVLRTNRAHTARHGARLFHAALSTGVTSLNAENHPGGSSTQQARPDGRVYITIGPQCSGKTTLLRQFAARDGVELQDIALDDHPEVYHRLPASTVAAAITEPAEAAGGELSRKLYCVRISERLRSEEQREFCLVVARLCGRLDQQAFAAALRSQASKGDARAADAVNELYKIVERAVAPAATHEGACWPMAADAPVDLFVREALFPKAVRAQQARFERLCSVSGARAQSVAWGNTNLAPRDYTSALTAAAQAQRPVVFVRWGHELPKVSLTELLRRNVVRVCATGRYIPAAVMATFLQRADALMARSEGGEPERLAHLAGFELDPRTQLVRPLAGSRSDPRRSARGRRSV